MAAHPPQPHAPQSVVLTFVGPIQVPAATRLRNACAHAVNGKTPRLTILFASRGGSLDEGFALYTFLRALPLELTMHAIGGVESIANVVFLAADKRLGTTECHFMFHPYSWPMEARHYVSTEIENYQELLKNSASKTYDILKKRTLLTDENLDDLQLLETVSVIAPDLAKEKGIIQEIADAKIPQDWLTYNVEF